jgi:hypothetical protein
MAQTATGSNLPRDIAVHDLPAPSQSMLFWLVQ